MTYEEALDVLMNKIQIDVNFTEDFNRDYDCLTKCKEALEKQIPKKHEIGRPYTWIDSVIKNGRRVNIEKTSYEKVCPICKKMCCRGDNYCKNCGQAIDWSEIK